MDKREPLYTVASNVNGKLEKATATHSSTLACKIPWTEAPSRLQSMRSWRVGHDWATSLSLFTFIHWRRKWQPTPVFLPGESQGRGSLVAAVYGVAQSRTRLKQLAAAAAMEHRMEFPQEIKNTATTYMIQQSHFCVCIQEKSISQRDSSSHMFIAALFHNQDIKTI